MLLTLQIVAAQEIEQTPVIDDPIITPDEPPLDTGDYLTWQDVYIIILVPLGAFAVMWIEKRADKNMVTPEAISLITENFVKSFNKIGDYVETTSTPIDNIAFDLAQIPLEMIKAELERRANPEL